MRPPGPAAHSGASAPAGAKKWVGIAAEIIPKVSSNAGQSLSHGEAVTAPVVPKAWPPPTKRRWRLGRRSRCPKFFARIRSQNFDRCHSFLLASSATGGARKRPPFHKGALGTGDADRRNQRPKFWDKIWLAVATPQARRPVGPPRNYNGFLSFRGAERRGNPFFLRWTRGGTPGSSCPTGGRREVSSIAGAALSEAESAERAAGQIQSLPDTLRVQHGV